MATKNELRQRELPPMKWWTVDLDRNALVTTAGGYAYELDLNEIDDMTIALAGIEALDWIQHVGGKSWANPEMVGELALFLSRRVMEWVWAYGGGKR